jgi:hypothetical protein
MVDSQNCWFIIFLNYFCKADLFEEGRISNLIFYSSFIKPVLLAKF